MDSQRRTEKKDPNSEEGYTEVYYTNLCGLAELKTHTSEQRFITFVGVGDTTTPLTLRRREA